MRKSVEKAFWGGLSVLLLLLVVSVVHDFNEPGDRQGLVGQLAPAFEFTSPTGERLSLASFRGKPVLLVFWANWCGICRQEMPKIAAYESSNSLALQIIAINVDHQKAEASIGSTPKMMIDEFDSGQLDGYNIEGIPASVLIDGGGFVRHVFLGGQAWTDPRFLSQLERFVSSG